MPEWFIVQLGAAKPPILVLVVEWQFSHAAVVAICDAGLPSTTVVAIVAPVWQLAQLVVNPVWFIVQVANVVVFVWQLSHAAVVAT
jgi:hypothetical protein